MKTVPPPPRGIGGRRPPSASGFGEDPMTWGVTVLRLGALRLRVHVLMLLWIGAELIAWIPRDAIGLAHVACATGSLVILTVAREITRLALARSLGSEADASVVWPLGGVEAAATPGTRLGPLAEFGGLLANLVLVPALGACVIATGLGTDFLLPDPLSPRAHAGGLRSVWQMAAWWTYYANVVLLLANALIPLPSLDAGRLLRVFLDRRHGPNAAGVAFKAACVATGGLFVLGAAASETRLMAVALFGLLGAAIERRRAEPLSLPPAPPAPDVPAASAPTLDDVLGKVSAAGLESLTEAEREVLAKETERRRRG